ncbi:putative ferredoxin reductase [Gordonia namibiensis NBRC 108229]|uniref:Putative ferredoxin reductase n=1 Tax=Gordonia namibiensis NBRC 108229 TaxID=1208314 RepID=K6VQZ4_9ACTN|nr:FAD-dependent oxidoreductase [Gordonia namibiensis]GAB98633.1 putative ferredoxin reductase [Gordonia namibiensis NBRC 108229]
MTSGRAVVIGASHAGAQLSAQLRSSGWDGDIVLIGDEPYLPYHRPPMSKTYLADTVGIDDLLIRGTEFYDKQNIRVRRARVERIDRAEQRVVLSDGESLSYDRLALCTGARPVRLGIPGAELRGVYYLRTAEDVEAIRADVPGSRRAVIVGGGYIGLETAASLRKLGLDVTVVEAADRVLQRVTAPEVSDFFRRIHEAEGVHIRTDAAVVGFEGDDGTGRVAAVRLADGEMVPADFVIVGIGVRPNVELAHEAGLAVDDGIVVDAQGRTSDPRITAAGDCVTYHDVRYGKTRLESVPSAGEQAKVAAATMCGKETTISALPWFWSDQYDLKLQIAGLNTGYDTVVLRGDPTTDREFACFYLRAGELIAADCVNRPQEFMFSKRVLAQSLPVDRDALADLDVPIASQLAAVRS